MSLSTRTTCFLGTGIVLATLALGVALWTALPDPMTIHWDATGTPDGTTSKSLGVFGLPLFTLVLLGLLLTLPRIDPLGENVERFRGYYNGFLLLFTASLSGLQVIVLAFNLGYDVDVTSLVLVIVGVIVGYAGVLMKRSEPNWFIGIRTPWTLSSETVWERTHALGGTLFVLAGVVIVFSAVVLSLFDRAELVIYVLLATVVIAALVPAVYSYYVFETLGRPDDRP